MPPKFNADSFNFKQESDIPEHIEGWPEFGSDPNKFHLVGVDTFANERYPLAQDIDDLPTAELLRQARLAQLEETQPSATSGGQSFYGIQDRVNIIKPITSPDSAPDGSTRRGSEHTPEHPA
jgi:hypothetical protein